MRDSLRLCVAALAVAGLMGCGEDVHTPTEQDVFNVYFWFPENKPPEGIYLGRVTGISACQRAAFNYASSKKLDRSAGWSYICCWEAKGSSCYSKHR